MLDNTVRSVLKARHPGRRWTAGRLLRGCVLGAAASGLLLATNPGAVLAESSTSIPVDRQTYVSDSGVDPYLASNDGPLTLHIGNAGGTETHHAFVHLELEALPAGALPTGGTLTLRSGDASKGDQVQPEQSIVRACVLTQELAANFDSSKPPPFDCNAAHSDGKVAISTSAGGTKVVAYTFDLKALLAKWTPGHNTGAALIANDPSGTWQVGFDRGSSIAVVSYNAPPPPQTSTQAPPGPSYITETTTTAPPYVRPPAGETPSQAGPSESPAAVPSPQASASPPAAPAAPPARTGGGGYPLWLVIVVGLVGAALGMVGPPLVQAISSAAPGAAAGGLLVPLRLHPRLLITAVVLLVWSMTFTAYSLVNTQPVTTAVAPGATASAQGGGAGEPGGGPGAGAAPSAAPGSVAARLPEHPVGVVTRFGNTSVVVPYGGGPPIADLYQGADDTIGIDSQQIRLCAHAALIFGPAFHISASDLNVFWTNLSDHGGVYGRNVIGTYQDDSYQPGPAVTAATNCKNQAGGTFFLLGGIGFDQIPAVRAWAETNRMLYIHHIATEQGGEGRYSFAPLPSVELVGRYFAELADSKYKGHKFGILWRNSSNWQPGRDAFLQLAHQYGLDIQVDDPVNNNQGDYHQQIVDLQSKNVDVVFAWENALAATNMIQQASGQNYKPHWMIFPFNLTTQTLGSAALNPTLDGVSTWPPYSCGNYSGPFAGYADEIHEFESEYAKYDPSADLCGVGGDLLFLNWVAQKATAQLLFDCGPQCTRNKVAGLLLSGYHKTVKPNCEADWSRRSHFGSYAMNLVETYTNPAPHPNGDGNVEWLPRILCKEHLL